MIAKVLQFARRLTVDPYTDENARRALGVLRARWIFRGCEIGPRVSAQSRVRVRAFGRIRIGAQAQFWEGVIPQELICFPGAELSIGKLSLFNYGVSIRAARSIRIGERCMFGSFVIVRDESGGRIAPVIIGDDVWVAHGAILEPGVSVGDRSVIGAGSVVCADVPPGMLAVGNPAVCHPLADGDRAADAVSVSPSYKALDQEEPV